MTKKNRNRLSDHQRIELLEAQNIDLAANMLILSENCNTVFNRCNQLTEEINAFLARFSRVTAPENQESE